jgi:hypothetical protein
MSSPRDYMRRAVLLLETAEEAAPGSPMVAQTYALLAIGNAVVAQVGLVVAVAEGGEET